MNAVEEMSDVSADVVVKLAGQLVTHGHTTAVPVAATDESGVIGA
jgi:hypothetical protein